MQKNKRCSKRGVSTAERKHALPFVLLDALFWQESRYNALAVSLAGARGLTHLMPGTASDPGVRNRFDPYTNTDGGARYSKQMPDQFDSVHLVLAAYNTGPGAVQRAKGITNNTDSPRYVRKILERWKESSRQDKERTAMTSTNTTRLRLTGKLIKGERHYLLQCEGETVWRLELLEVDVPEESENVIVDGLMSGIDSIDVDWIGSKTPTENTEML